MKSVNRHSPLGDATRQITHSQVLFLLVSLTAIFFAFALANSHIEIEAKTRGFSGIITGFLLACVCLHFWQSRRAAATAAKAAADLDRDTKTESGLRSLEEASEFFSGSIKAADMFRLVSNRVRLLTPFRTSALFLLDETGTHLYAAETDGDDAGRIKNRVHSLTDRPVGTAFSKHNVDIAETASDNVAVIPMLAGAEPFGVLCLYFDKDNKPTDSDAVLFEAIGVRVAPLVASSISLEKSLSNAMTDSTTDLPNERALNLVLENQIAETLRNRDERPLTVLALDIKNFDEINQKYGHAAGDHVLSFVSQIIKDNLRQMDFLARATGDEFLAILPTAPKEISHEIIARIHTGFFGRRLKINGNESVEVELNSGWAAFGNDGETPNVLLAAARLRKEQSKSSAPGKVLWFPQELVN